GHPEVCTVFALHQSFNPNNITDIENKCKNAVRGCVECKKMLAEAVIDSLSGFQKKRKELEKDKEIVKRTLKDGAEKAGFVIRDCLEGVRERISLKLV
ncbi:MAG: tryptophan--tRNA ligase, partial [Actinomycetia bacterium]|nr:tryptophan--tRNA ligase [Actinomycetes bacterium]